HHCLDVGSGAFTHELLQSHLRADVAFFSAFQLPFGILYVRVEQMDEFRDAPGPEPAEAILHGHLQNFKHRLGEAAACGRRIANPLQILKQIAGGVAGVFGSSTFTKQVYLDSLKTSYDLFNNSRREDLVSLESDIEEPEKSPILSKKSAFIKNHHVMQFFCDTM